MPEMGSTRVFAGDFAAVFAGPGMALLQMGGIARLGQGIKDGGRGQGVGHRKTRPAYPHRQRLGLGNVAEGLGDAAAAVTEVHSNNVEREIFHRYTPYPYYAPRAPSRQAGE